MNNFFEICFPAATSIKPTQSLTLSAPGIRGTNTNRRSEEGREKWPPGLIVTTERDNGGLPPCLLEREAQNSTLISLSFFFYLSTLLPGPACFSVSVCVSVAVALSMPACIGLFVFLSMSVSLFYVCLFTSYSTSICTLFSLDLCLSPPVYTSLSLHLFLYLSPPLFLNAWLCLQLCLCFCFNKP